MFPYFIWRVVSAEFVDFVFDILIIHMSTDDQDVVFRNTTDKVR